MQYAICQPIEAYGVVRDGVELGLYHTYKDRPALMAAIFMMTGTPYLWEPGSPIQNYDDRPAEFIEFGGLLIDTLYASVGGRMITGLLSDLDPLQFALFLDGLPLYHLPICRMIEPASLIFTVKARAATWTFGRYGIRAYSDNVLSTDLISQLQRIEKQAKEEMYALARTSQIH